MRDKIHFDEVSIIIFQIKNTQNVIRHQVIQPHNFNLKLLLRINDDHNVHSKVTFFHLSQNVCLKVRQEPIAKRISSRLEMPIFSRSSLKSFGENPRKTVSKKMQVLL